MSQRWKKRAAHHKRMARIAQRKFFSLFVVGKKRDLVKNPITEYFYKSG